MLFLWLFTGQSSFAQNCYLQIEGRNLSKEISSLSQSFISQYVEHVQSIPIQGNKITQKHCIYKITVNQKNNNIIISISGRNLNSIGDSKLQGIDGIQQALLKALYRGNPNKISELCNNYSNFLEIECRRDIQSVIGYASISHQCAKSPCPSQTILKLKAIDVAKIIAMDELAMKLGVSVKSIQTVKNGRMEHDVVETKSGGHLINVIFSEALIKDDEVSIRATAEIQFK